MLGLLAKQQQRTTTMALKWFLENIEGGSRGNNNKELQHSVLGVDMAALEPVERKTVSKNYNGWKAISVASGLRVWNSNKNYDRGVNGATSYDYV